MRGTERLRKDQSDVDVSMLWKRWQASHHYGGWRAWSLVQSCCSCDPEPELRWSPPPTLPLKASTQLLCCSLPLCCVHRLNLLLLFQHGGPLWTAGFRLLCQRRFLLIKWFTHYCSLASTMQCIRRLLYSVTGAVAWSCRSCVWRCVSCWKPRLPCPCDPYGHCQRPCQGSAPYQLACSPLWLSLPTRGGEQRRKEKGGECCLFACLPALFYLGGGCLSQWRLA